MLLRSTLIAVNLGAIEPSAAPLNAAVRAAVAGLVPDAMKNAGILMGMTGGHGNVLKVRPPLVFDEDNADQLLTTLDEVLADLVSSAGQ